MAPGWLAPLVIAICLGYVLYRGVVTVAVHRASTTGDADRASRLMAQAATVRKATVRLLAVLLLVLLLLLVRRLQG